MIVTLLLWAWMAALSYVYGSMTKRLLQKMFLLKKNGDVPFPAVMVLGLCALGLAVNWFSIWIKIGIPANAVIVLGGAVYLLFDFRYLAKDLKEQWKRMRNMDPVLLTSLLAVIALVLAETSFFVPKNYDTAVYHAQAIRWAENYPALPGLGNLHNRLAYNSAWLVLNALFSFSFLKVQSFHALNGFLMSVSMLYFFLLLPGQGNKKISFTGIFALILIPASYYIQVNFISSPGTDTPAAFMIWTLLLYFLTELEKSPEDRSELAGPVILFVGCFLIMVKLSAMPVLILPLFLFLKDLFSRRLVRVGTACLLAAVVLAPWLARNVVLSGYLIYPFSSLDLFNVDWKMPKPVLLDDARQIAIWSNAYRGGDFFHYLAAWFFKLGFHYQVIVYPVLAFWLSGVVCLAVRLVSEGKNRLKFISEKSAYAVLYVMSYASMIYLFFTAPDVRYGSVFFIVFGLLHGVPVLATILKKKEASVKFLRVYGVLLVIGLVLFEAFLFNRYFHASRTFTTYRMENIGILKTRLVLPADYPRDMSANRVYPLGGNFVYYVPEVIGLSWYEPFPSVPYAMPDIRLRTGDVSGGFRIK